MSAEVTDVPSSNLVLGRKVTVHTVLVEFGVTDWARYGSAVPLAAYFVSES